jgi:hypothetical protein
VETFVLQEVLLISFCDPYFLSILNQFLLKTAPELNRNIDSKKLLDCVLVLVNIVVFEEFKRIVHLRVNML